jgi:hypothetical protein
MSVIENKSCSIQLLYESHRAYAVDLFDQEKYVKIWLRTHNNAESGKNSWRETDALYMVYTFDQIQI